MSVPILILGAGRMGGALIEGWTRVGAFAPSDLILRDPNPGLGALGAEAAGARLNPPDAVLREAATVLLAVKPQIWRQAAEAVVPLLQPGAVVVSIAAGVPTAQLSEAFFGRPVARVMPTTAVALAKGVASIFATEEVAAHRAHALFDPVATSVDLDDEGLMDAATGVSGSAPAYLYAFIEALEAAAEAQGIAPEAASQMVRATLIGAAALLDHTGEEPAELRRQVTSPGGTTEAALKVLMGEGGLWPLLDRAVSAAVTRAKELGS
ncbi:MAG: pyrroline-5-carboxylate reductase [Caulobacteraceae bacterium]|nr:pyrroline-5-carboxylate reductase [Caulobacteraceae bacterium]